MVVVPVVLLDLSRVVRRGPGGGGVVPNFAFRGDVGCWRNGFLGDGGGLA